MSINLKQINLYNEQEPYDVDVDNRPLLDIQDNITELTGLLESLGYYSEVSADLSVEPAGGFSVFSCGCIYSNGLLIPIDISKSIAEIDYTKYPIVLILGYKTGIKKYSCLSFSAGIKLSSKFASFLPGAEGRLLLVGPGGELVDSLYYGLSHASRGYQALYVGKIISPTSIVFGGNQVSFLGNNYYLGKNRDETTSGLITVQRSNADSNTVFKAMSVDSVGTTNFAEFINTGVSNLGYETGVGVFFANKQLPFSQATSQFTVASLETYLNKVHFASPTISAEINNSQEYKTAGVNVRGILDFASTNLLHSAYYSNNAAELAQNISSKLVFSDHIKVNITDEDIPIGVTLNSKSKFVGSAISSISNLPTSLLPTVDTTGIIFGDYFGTTGTGAYIGSVVDDPSGTHALRLSAEDELTAQTTANWTTNKISEFESGFNLLISTKKLSTTTTSLANIILSTDGYINLSSGKGILTNKAVPTLDAEVVSLRYVNLVEKRLSAADSMKIPLTGTGLVSTAPVTGSLSFDVFGNDESNSRVLSIHALSYAEIDSDVPVRFTNATSYQTIHAKTEPDLLSITTQNYEVVNKGYLFKYIDSVVLLDNTHYVTRVGATPQDIEGEKTFTSSLYSDVSESDDNIIMLTTNSITHTPSTPIIFNTLGGTLTIGSTNQTKLDRQTQSGDSPLALTTKKYVDDSVGSIGLDWADSSRPINTSPQAPYTGLKNVARHGWVVQGNIVMYWATSDVKSTISGAAFDGGDAGNPEYDIGIPPDMFSEIFNIQVSINNPHSGGAADDVWVQLINFQHSNLASFRIKYQGSYGMVSNGVGYATTIFIVGAKNPSFVGGI